MMNFFFHPRGLLLPLLVSALVTATAAPLPFLTWAPRPPMGWNSWDYYGTSITEEQARAQAAFMAEKLRPSGWEYFVVDIQWYEPQAKGHDYRKDAVLAMDAYGRLLPAPNRFPSAGDAGFKPLADHVHALGLKFGIHLMRGIPRQAVEQNLSILGTPYRASDIANRASTCPWNPDMFGVDTTKPGAQEYYDSVLALIASWGVDYLKVDDLSRPYHQGEIEAIRRAIDKTGRPIVLSLSPGDTPLSAAPHVVDHANLWRISDDFWDRWLALHEQFGRLEQWNPHRVTGAWPDADMLPLGWLSNGRRQTRFTRDEQLTLMTLWSIARCPLMHGGDMTRTDDFTLSLLTNPEVIAVNQHSANNRPLFNDDDLIGWVADVPGSPDKYIALFNARDPLRLTSANAAHVSRTVTRDPATAAEIDVEVRGANRLVLAAQPATPDGNAQALWRDARLGFADGSTRPLADLQWIRTDATWDSTRRKRVDGATVGLTAISPAFIDYELPADAVRFQATAMVDAEADPERRAAALRFLVVLGTPANEERRAGLPVTVDLAQLGFTGPVTVRDLWARHDLGRFAGQLAPEVPWHGAVLYRLTPATP